MENNPHFTASFSREAVGFLFSLGKRNQNRVLDIADRIAEWPEGISDLVLTDAKGRSVHSVLVDEFLFSYYVDHAIKEILITEVVQV
ncbi:MAG: hypothetical protein ABQ298_02810 [Puniceicoccaceae bacterium]